MSRQQRTTPAHGLNFPKAGTPLNWRELQVLAAAAAGRSNRDIGKQLSLTEDTVKTYMRRIFRKLLAVDRANAVAIGLSRGLLTMPAGSTPRVRPAEPSQAPHEPIGRTSSP